MTTKPADTGRSVYDGFISYSHAADDLLAPRLQSGLQRFAKPWWKRRALRVFRDESSLSANPHLWESITEALDTSGWFVLLLSPDAARSEWVNQEIAYWVERKDASRILPVVTAGEFGWADGDVTGDSVPDALRGVFASEPRWVDLRFARREQQLDLQDPRFADAIADVASAMRGVPKDELAGEEVRQHRRTVRTAWAAGGLLVMLAAAAVWGGVLSARNADEARANAEQARESAEAETAARAEADQNALRADEEAAAARSAERLAFARELAASAIGVIDEDPQLALLLALEAIFQSPDAQTQPVEVLDALWEAGAANRLVDTIDHGFLNETDVSVSDDGSRIVFSAFLGSVRMYDGEDLSLLWEVAPPDGLVPTWSAISPDGSLVAVPFVRPAPSEGASGEMPQPSDDNHVAILDGESGALVARVPFPECVNADRTAYPAWSYGSDRLAVSSARSPCPRDDLDEAHWVEVFSTESWEQVALLGFSDLTGFGITPRFDRSGRLFVLGDVATRVYDTTYDLETTVGTSFGYGDISPDGSKVVTFYPFGGEPGLAVFDVESGARIDLLTPLDEFSNIPNGVRFSSEGSFVIVGNESETTYVWDAETGRLEARLHGGIADSVWVDEASSRAFTAHRNTGRLNVWTVGPSRFGLEVLGEVEGRVGVPAPGRLFPEWNEVGGFLVTSPDIGDIEMRFFDVERGVLLPVAVPIENTRDQVLDAGFVLTRDDTNWVTYDPLNDVESPLFDCAELDEESCVVRVSVDSPALRVVIDAVVQSFDEAVVHTLDEDGSLLGTVAIDGDNVALAAGDEWVIFRSRFATDLFAVDLASGEVLESWTGRAQGAFQVSPSGGVAFAESPFMLIDLQTWESAALPALPASPQSLAFDESERFLAASTEGLISIYDLEQRAIVQSPALREVAYMLWLDSETLLVITRSGVIGELSLRTDDLRKAAANSVLRGFSAQECTTYRIDPCPTLEEIRDR